MKQLIKYLFFYLFSGAVYFGIEMVFRQFSTIEMFVLAGFLGLFIMSLNNIYTYEMDYLLQVSVSTIFVTIGELIVGLIFNQDYHIWDYRDMIFTLFNYQICLEFSLLWCGLCALFIPLLDYMEWKICKYKLDTPPYYKIFGKRVFQFKK